MKRFCKYLYKHLSTTLTLLVTIITAVVVNCVPSICVGFLDNFLMVAVIGLNLTFLFDFTRNMDAIDDKITDLEKLLPSSRIETFESVDQVAEQLTSMVTDGNHEIDIVLFDTKIRTSDPNKVSKMNNFIELCSNSRMIKLRLAFVPSTDSICQRIDNIINSEKNNCNSFYAYQESTLTFASFMIIDNSFISIRTPHKNGSKSLYCIAKEKKLCSLYSSWFDILWGEASHINKDNFLNFIYKYKKIIPKEEMECYKKKWEELTK